MDASGKIVGQFNIAIWRHTRKISSLLRRKIFLKWNYFATISTLIIVGIHLGQNKFCIYIYIYIYIYQTLNTNKMWKSQLFKRDLTSLHSKISFFIPILKSQSAQLFIHMWRENSWVHTFRWVISTMWNTFDLVQNLNAASTSYHDIRYNKNASLYIYISFGISVNKELGFIPFSFYIFISPWSP